MIDAAVPIEAVDGSPDNINTNMVNSVMAALQHQPVGNLLVQAVYQRLPHQFDLEQPGWLICKMPEV